MKYGYKNKEGVRVGGARRLIGKPIDFLKLLDNVLMRCTSLSECQILKEQKNKICMTILAYKN